MPNIPVPAAATGLPKVSRRAVVSALAASTAMAPALACDSPSPDVELLRLFGEWVAANKARDTASDESCRIGEILDDHDEAFPIAARFKQHTNGGFDEVPDSFWDELISVSTGVALTRAYRADAHLHLRDGLARTDWTPRADTTVHLYSGKSPHHWVPPYAPPLRARVREILEAWEPWEAERQRLIALHKAAETEQALEDAEARCTALEVAMAGIPAVGVDGHRIKATIVASAGYNRTGLQSRLAACLAGDYGSVEGMKASLLLDLADWQAISREALS
jgi:hypothetical protein